MNNYVIAGVLVFVGLGFGWFLMSGDSTPAASEVAVTENEMPDSLDETRDPAATPNPVATVNGAEISSADFNAQQSQILMSQGVADPATLDAETQTSIQNQVLDSLISQELLKQAAVAEGVEVAEAEVETQLDVIRSQFEDETLYEQALASEGLTEDELRTQIKADLSIEPYLEEKIDLASITVTEEEVNQVYEQASAQQELPPLEDVRGQLEQTVVQQKQQPLINQHLAELREVADIEIFI